MVRPKLLDRTEGMQVDQGRTCFVVMPIRSPGTPEHEHFKTIRDTIITPPLVALGYAVTRADDINYGGAITSDVVNQIAQSDLVVADLTDLNANVFYELGIRHALRKFGTVMLVDESRTEIPFDLANYRVIKYEPTLRGAEHVREKIQEFARTSGDDPHRPDNPVHTFLPALPLDLLEHSTGTAEGRLRSEIDLLRKELAAYRSSYGELRQDALLRLHELLEVESSRARDGISRDDLMARARSAVQQRNSKEFLDALRLIFNEGIRPTAAEYVELGHWADELGFSDLSSTINLRAQEQYPEDPVVERLLLQSFAHSSDPRSRRRARDGYQRILGIETADGRVHIPDSLDRINREILGVMLDSYHRDGMHEEALEVTTHYALRYPEDDIILRNHARALDRTGADREALIFYRAALVLSSPDSDTNANWLGATLARYERYADAVEVFAAACMLDPDDGENFLDVAEQCQDALRLQTANASAPFLRGRRSLDRALPAEITHDTVVNLVAAAFSCPTLDSADLQQAHREFDTSLVEDLLARRLSGEESLDRAHRVGLAERVYTLLASPLTQDSHGIEQERDRLLSIASTELDARAERA